MKGGGEMEGDCRFTDITVWKLNNKSELQSKHREVRLGYNADPPDGKEFELQ